MNKYTLMIKSTNIGLLIFFGCCLLEWPPNNSYFVFEMIFELFFKKKDVSTFIFHPVILAGIFGAGCLVYNTVTGYKKWVQIVGVLLLGILVLLFLLSGIFSKNIKMITSTLPFIVLGIYSLRYKKTQI